MTAATSIDVNRFLADIRTAALASEVFGEVLLLPQGVRCRAKDSAAEAWYSIVLAAPSGVRDSSGADAATWWVRLATPDRWLSESIEADLMHNGDPLEELVEEELIDLGHDPKQDGDMPTIKHFRSDDKLYTFENKLPINAYWVAGDVDSAVKIASRFLLAYEAAFRQLGDMAGGDEE